MALEPKNDEVWCKLLAWFISQDQSASANFELFSHFHYGLNGSSRWKAEWWSPSMVFLDCSNQLLKYCLVAFQGAFQTTTKRQQERLIVLIRRLTMENPSGLASKTLEFFWDLATRPSLLPEIGAAAAEAHSGILTDVMKATGSVSRLSYLYRYFVHLP